MKRIKGLKVSCCFALVKINGNCLSKRRHMTILDKAIKLLQGTSSKLEMAMLSYFYGMKMDYLLNDSRSKEALEVGLKREKLLKDIAKLPEKNKRLS